MKNHKVNLLGLFLLGILLTACATPTTPAEALPQITKLPTQTAPQSSPMDVEITTEPTETSQPTQVVPKETNIKIDGDSSDWVSYEVLFTDSEGDAQAGGFDIAALRAFMNDKYLYVLVETHGPSMDYIQVDLDVSVGGRDFIISFHPQESSTGFMGDVTGGEFKEIGQIIRSQSAAAEAMEFKLPLSVFGDISALTLGIRPMAGECCAPPKWYVVDEIGQAQVSQLEENEPAQDLDLTKAPHSPGANLLIPQTLVDLNTVRGDEPTDLVMSTDGSRIYTIGRNTDTLFVIDVPENQIISIIEIEGINDRPYGSRPEHLALTEDDNWLLVANFNDGSITIFDTTALEVITTLSVLPEVFDVAVTPDGSFGYAISRTQPQIAQIDLEKLTSPVFINIPVPAFAVAVSPEGNLIYAACSEGIFVIDSITRQIAQKIELPIKGYMGNILLNRNGSTAYVSMRDTNQVLEIDLAEEVVQRSFTVKAASEGLALNPKEDRLFVGTFGAFQQLDYTVAVIDLLSGEMVGKIMPLSPAEHVSWVPDVEGIAVTPDGSQVYFATVDADAVFIADIESLEHTGTIPLTNFARLQPSRLVITPDGSMLFTTNAAPQVASISMISTNDKQVDTFFYENSENSSCIARVSGVDIAFDNLVYITAGDCLLTFDPLVRDFVAETRIQLPAGLYFTDIAVNSSEQRAFLLDNGGGLISVNLINKSTSERLQVLSDGFNLKMGSNDERIYITGGTDYAVVDAETMQIIKVDTASFIENKQFANYPNRIIGIEPLNNFYLIGDFDSFTVFDTAHDQRLRTIKLEQWSPHRQLATDAIFTPDGDIGYLALWDMKGIVAFDPNTWQVLAQIDTGSAPYYVICPDDFAISPDGRRLYVSGEQSDNIMVIDTETNQVIDIIDLVP